VDAKDGCGYDSDRNNNIVVKGPSAKLFGETDFVFIVSISFLLLKTFLGENTFFYALFNKSATVSW
jgi:hypothetical protein